MKLDLTEWVGIWPGQLCRTLSVWYPLSHERIRGFRPEVSDQLSEHIRASLPYFRLTQRGPR